jgi:RNA polymerase sigma-70 factor (ECF subfamily)
MQSYQRYGPALLRKAERLLQNRDDAKDVVQSLFLDLLEQGEDASELPYLYRAVTNRCLNVIRDRRNRERLLAQKDAVLRGPVRTSFEARVIDLDLLLKLANALDAQSCEVLVYRYIDDMQLEEIAELIGVSRKTVGKRLDQARDAVLRLAGHPGGAA